MDAFFELVEARNTTLEAARADIRAVDSTTGFRVGPFSRSATPRSVQYDAARLPAELLAMPGVIKKIDGDVLESLVVAGVTTEEAISTARNLVNGTPKISGVKDIVLDF